MKNLMILKHRMQGNSIRDDAMEFIAEAVGRERETERELEI